MSRTGDLLLPPPRRLDAIWEKGRPNSIGFLRYVLAALVVVSHAYPLGGFGRELLVRSGGADTFGGLAVSGFFILSGLLIAASYVRSASVWRFLWHRFLRIFPGYWVCLLVVAFGFGPLIHWLEHGTVKGYFDFWRDSPTQFVRANALLALKQHGIGTLLEGNPYPRAINGALWSLEYEFKCYLLIAALGVTGLLARFVFVGRGLVLALYLLFAAKNSWWPQLLPTWTWLWQNDQMMWLVMWFLAGTLTYLFAPRLPVSPWLATITGIVSAACLFAPSVPIYRCVAPLAFSYTLFWLALKLPLTWWDRPGDFSYGLYIYAFPVQQLLALLGLHRHGVFLYIVAALAISTALAVVSYRLIEKPALRWKDWPRRKLPSTLRESTP